jgi:CO/xanthine dehydrogenase FAD-binding subunit
VRARDFFTGALTTVRNPDELLVALDWPRGPADAGHAFEEIAQRHGDFAIAAAACEARLDGAGRVASLAVALGGVEDRPIALDTAEFIGGLADDAMARAVGSRAGATVEPMEDHTASSDYRGALAEVLVERVVLRAVDDARQKRNAS